MFVSIRTRLLLSHLAVALVAAVAASIYLFLSFTKLQAGYSEHTLLSSAYALADAIETDFGTAHGKILIEHAIEELTKDEKTQFAVMDTDGKVVSSTTHDIHSGSILPRMNGVQSGKPNIYHPRVRSLEQKRIIVDVPLEHNRAVVGVVRAWIVDRDYQASLSPIKHITGLALVGVVALCVLLSSILAYALISPINNMRRLSRRIAQGDFGIRISKGSGDELGELAADLNTMAARLQDLENSRRDFFGNVSHELRSPVSNIRITSEVLGRRAERIGGDSARLFETIVSETERLEELINELMDVSAIQSGSLRLDMEVFDLKTLLEDLMASLQPHAQRKNIELYLNADSDINLVADRTRMARAINNLLDNAVRYTPERGRVTLIAKHSEDHATIDVTDTGCGIAREDIPKIFERFYRTGATRNTREGVGIGLALVKHIIEAHGGSVTVSSKEDQGSTFRIRLPLK